MRRAAHIVSAFRTPVAPRAGALSACELHEIAAPVVSACLKAVGVAANEVDELIVGNALGAGGNPARVIALAAGLDQRVAGLSIDRQCCAGLDALLLAKAMVESGQADIVVAGGAESYSRRPLRLRPSADGSLALAYEQARFTPWPDRDPDMGQAADELARQLGISRLQQDCWAIESHRRALRAGDRLRDEIVLVPGIDIKADAYTRNLTTKLCARAPLIRGSITHANTAVAADAAAFCLVVADHVAKGLSTASLRLASGLTLGGLPECPGLAPVAAIAQVLDEAGLTADQLVLAEIMEAYAVQAIACVQQSGLDPQCVNRHGGALARGHPVGASGAVLAVRVFHDLRRSGGWGLAAIAAAGGLGTAVLFRG